MATHLPEEIDYNPLSPEARSNPEVQCGVLRRTQPVHHFALPEDELKKMSSNVFAAEPTTEFWTVLRHQHVEEVLSNPQLFLSCQGPGVDRMRPDPNGGVLIFADGKVHRRHRQLASKAFAPRSVERLLPQIQQSVDALIDEHAARGRMELTQARMSASAPRWPVPNCASRYRHCSAGCPISSWTPTVGPAAMIPD